MIISILICTHNRRDSLRDTLDSLWEQHGADSIDHEIVVIDNHSSDGTADLVRDYQQKFNGRLRYVFEERVGLPFARNKGVLECKGEVVAFTDDDCVPRPDYVRQLARSIAFWDHDIEFMGGRVYPRWLTPKRPPWLNRYFFGPLALLDYGDDRFIVDKDDLHKRRLFVGANLVFKREVFAKHGLFDTKKTFAQDTEICLRLLRSGVKGLYNPDLIVDHKIPPVRLQPGYFYHWNYQRGRMRALDDERDIKALYPIGMLAWLSYRMAKDVVHSLMSGSDYDRIRHRCFFWGHWGMMRQIVAGQIKRCVSNAMRLADQIERRRSSRSPFWIPVVRLKDFFWSIRPERLRGEGYILVVGIRDAVSLRFGPARRGLAKSSQGQSCRDERYDPLRKIFSRTDGDYILLDVPNHLNIGDHLICQGQLDFLQECGLRQRYIAPHDHCDLTKIREDDLILLQGGGNFGDLYGDLHRFKERVIERFKENQIVCFPQTVYFRDQKKLKRSVAILSRHQHLTICARDKNSFDILNRFFQNNTVYLVPDMAMCLDLPCRRRSGRGTDKVLFLKRNDEEFKEGVDVRSLTELGMEVCDWPSFENPGLRAIPHKFKYRSFFVNSGVAFMSRYDLVVTDRLHGALLAIKLGIPCILMDNSYGKNKTYYQTWFKQTPGCFYAEDQFQLEERLSKHFSDLIKFQRRPQRVFSAAAS